MGGKGSGRKPDVVKMFNPKRANVASIGGEPLELPNYSGVKKFQDDHAQTIWKRDGTRLEPVNDGESVRLTSANGANIMELTSADTATSIVTTVKPLEFKSGDGLNYFNSSGNNNKVLIRDSAGANALVLEGTTTAGNITAASGEIDFDNENLTTTGDINAKEGKFIVNAGNDGVHIVDGGTDKVKIIFRENSSNICSWFYDGTGAGDTNELVLRRELATAKDLLNVTMGGNFDFNAGNMQTTGKLGVGVGASAGKTAINSKIATSTASTETTGIFNDTENSSSETSFFGGAFITGLWNDVDTTGTHTATFGLRNIFGVRNVVTSNDTVNGSFDFNSVGTSNEVQWSGTNTANTSITLTGTSNLCSGNIGTTGSTNKRGQSITVTGTADNNYGILIQTVSGATNNYGIYDKSGADWVLDGDNQKISIGETNTDLEFFSDGTNGVIDVATALRLGNDVTNYAQINSTGDLTFEGTARIDWDKWTADSVTATGFTAVGQVVGDLQTANDGNVYTAIEQAGGNNDITVDFVSVTAFNWVKSLAIYDGSSSHAIAVQLYNWSTTSWDDFDCMQNAFTDSGDFFCNQDFFVPSDTNYIGTGGDAGKVRVRYLHSTNTSTNHELLIDECSLRQ